MKKFKLILKTTRLIMTGKVSYSKELKEKATQDKLHLITIDTPNLMYQTMVSTEMLRQIDQLAVSLLSNTNREATRST